MSSTLIDLLHQSVSKYPDKAVVVHGDKKLGYLELWQRASGLAHYLVDNGLKLGDRVSLLIDNSPEYVIAYYGVLMAGGAAIGLNTAAKSRDLSNWINHSDSSFLIAKNKHPELKELKGKIALGEEKIIYTESSDNDSSFSMEQSPIKESAPDDRTVNDPDNMLASIIYTSGTTGHPKGVMLSHTNLYENTQSILKYLELDKTDSILNVLPFYYSYGNSILHIHLAVGATLVLENSMLYPQKVVKALEEHKVTGFSGVPSTFNLILSRTNLQDFDLSSIRYMTQAGGPMAPAAIERLKKELPRCKFFVMYGQTEASARLSYLPPGMLEKKLGSIGIAIPGVELELRSEHDGPVDPGKTGEIHAKGKNIMMGYWKDEGMTSEVKVDGWLKTGDLAYQDEDGYFFIVGRSSEMIKSGANRISPKDIEEVLLELEGIEETAVVGIDDEILGQVIKAVIVKSPGSDIDRMKVMRHCKLNLANYKLPKIIDFTDRIPRTASGKVRRFMLQN